MYSSLIYKKSPIFVQSIMVSLLGLVRGAVRSERRISKLKKRLKDNEYSDELLETFCYERLENALKCARGTEAFKDKSQFSEFDFIDKNDVKASPKSFINRNVRSYITVKGSTSGTSGTPLSIPQNLESVLREHAFISRYLEWAGFKEGDRRAWIRGEVVVPIEQKQGPFWRYSYFENMIVMSSFHLSSSAIPSYLRAMQNYGVDIIQAYPSSITTLAKFLESKDLYYQGNLKSIMTSSEALSQEDLQLIEKRFRCKVFDWYGLFERVAAIGRCEHGNYHVISDYSHVELIKSDHGKHEIVGTNYNNSFFPLIRYRTGDHVTLSSEQSCPCGRVYPVVESIDGRRADYVFNSQKEKVFALGRCIKGVSGVLGSQFIQKEHGKVSVHVVCNDQFGPEQEIKLIENVKDRLGRDIVVEPVKVESLIRTKNGKVKRAICLVEEDQ